MAITPKVLIELGITDTNLQKRVAEARAEVERLKKSKEDLAKQNKLTATAEAQLNAEIKNATDTQRKAENQLKAFVATTKSYEGSIEQAAGVSKVLTAEFNRMSASEREATEDGKKLSAALKVANDELRNQGVATGNMRSNVGNYTEAINNSLVGIRSQIQALKEENETLDITSAKFQQNKTRIEELTLQYNVASGKVDEFGDRMKKSAAAENLDRINDAGQGAAGALMLFGVAAGASTQASEAEKNVLMALQVVTAAYALWKGRVAALELADTAYKKGNAIATIALTRAQQMWTAAVSTTAGAFKLLKAAIVATGIGALVAIFAELVFNTDEAVASMDKFLDKIGFLGTIVKYTPNIYTLGKAIQWIKTQFDDGIPSADEFAKKLDSIIAGVDNLAMTYDNHAKGLQRNIDLRKAEGAGITELYTLEKEYRDYQIKAINSQLSVLKLIPKSQKDVTKQINDLEQKKLDLYNQNTTAALDYAKAVGDLTKAQKENLAVLLTDVKELENRLLGEDFSFRLAQISENYQKEQLLLVEAKDKGVITQERYNKDSLALLTNYQTEVNRLLLEQANFEDASTNETNDAKLLAYENQLAQQKAFEQASLDSAKQYANEQGAEFTKYSDNIAQANQDTLNRIVAISDAVAGAIEGAFENGKFNAKKFGKEMLKIVIDIIQKQVEASILGSVTIASGLSFSTPDSVATFGASGAARVAVLLPLIKAAFAVFKGAIGGLMELEKGGEIPKAANGLLVGPSHANGGIPAYAPGGPIEMEGGEAVINKRSTAMFRPLLSAINEAGGGVRFANGGSIGTAARVETNIFDYNKLAAAIANIPAPVVTVEDINAGQAKFARVAQKTVL